MTAEPPGTGELRQDIERTRERLGETVEQLAAKADVKSQAKARAAELAGRVKTRTAHARERAATQVGQAVARTGAQRQKAVAVSGAARAQLQSKAAPVASATPEPVRRVLVKGASTARARRRPLVATAAGLAAAWLALWWWRNR
jgi:Protein of unknown function (DUF3618)